jgi:hypothetical protein
MAAWTAPCALLAMIAAVASARRTAPRASRYASARRDVTSTGTCAPPIAIAAGRPGPDCPATATCTATFRRGLRSASVAIRWAAIRKATSVTTRTMRARSRRPATTVAARLETRAPASSTSSGCPAVMRSAASQKGHTARSTRIAAAMAIASPVLAARLCARRGAARRQEHAPSMRTAAAVCSAT